jgi:hypothetical protein
VLKVLACGNQWNIVFFLAKKVFRVSELGLGLGKGFIFAISRSLMRLEPTIFGLLVKTMTANLTTPPGILLDFLLMFWKFSYIISF